MKRTAALIATSLALASCGGSAANAPGPKIMNCFVSNASPDTYEVNLNEAELGVLARDAGDRAAQLTFERNSAAVVVERSEANAKATLAQYRLFYNTVAGPGDGQLTRTGSVVVAFDKTPTPEEREAIARCVGA